MRLPDDWPICAIATAAGKGAIGIVRISGRSIGDLDRRLTGRALADRVATFGPFLDDDGTAIDHGLAIRFQAPRSYTGEDVLELQGHGGPVVQQLILQRVLRAGADFGIRLARPGEFTERAYLNDKLDLAQAEAVADLIDASTAQAARSAARSLSGEFSRRIEQLAAGLLELRMLVEATLDFPDEEIEFIERANGLGRLAAIEAALEAVLGTARQGALLTEGLSVVLVGAPNVGKSSLLNALAGAEVAIVTPVAGTTRDRISQAVAIDGVPLNLVDTAGLRDSDDVVERIGIERTWDEIGRADVIVHLVEAAGSDSAAVHAQDVGPARAHDVARAASSSTDSSSTDSSSTDSSSAAPPPSAAPPSAASPNGTPPNGTPPSSTLPAAAPGSAEADVLARIDARAPAGASRLRVVNKIDRTGETARADDAEVRLSALTGAGIDLLRARLLRLAGHQPQAENVFAARERHLDALRTALGHVVAAREQAALGDAALELFAEELRLAHGALGRITGEVTADELLGVIFSRFCIGK
ncbi:MAG: tRNA uridine-5-carboxymethylaminomethyl(34) synthesis GTPase MnmE [Burkholderiaceae bacterium]